MRRLSQLFSCDTPSFTMSGCKTKQEANSRIHHIHCSRCVGKLKQLSLVLLTTQHTGAPSDGVRAGPGALSRCILVYRSYVRLIGLVFKLPPTQYVHHKQRKVKRRHRCLGASLCPRDTPFDNTRTLQPVLIPQNAERRAYREGFFFKPVA